jgi:hypothetical protein
MDKVNMTTNQNRRGSFRIHDEVNLFYKKIDEKSATEPQPIPITTGKEAQDAALTNGMAADVQFNKNETCDINISASGLAFNCDAALKEGDCLMVKIMLASGKKPIVAPCQVVYCRSSQANDSECPYFVGAHFINMKDEDQELLIEHVDKKRLHSRWINGFILAVVITVIALPDVVFGLLLELFHFLLELLLEFSHLTFEFIESNLDHLVEHLFETDVHATQVIVFYIIFPFVCYGLYRLFWAIPSFFRRIKKKQVAYWSRKKAYLLFYWRELSPFNKLKLVLASVAVIALYVLFGF